MDSLILKLKSTYTFEGKEYTEIDLTGLERLNALQLKTADKQFAQDGNIAAMNEMTLGYACIVARFATGLPAEFFDGLPAKDAVALKNMVTGFFFN